MAQARLTFFGALLLALALPGHPLVPLSGLPLGLTGLVLVLAVVGWLIALPSAPPGATRLTVVLLVLAALKTPIWWAAPAYGLDAGIRLSASPAIDPIGDVPRYRGVAPALDFEGDTFPVHFVNDIRYLNFYTPSQPRRDLLPFEASWQGLLNVQATGPQVLTLEANGVSSLDVGGQRVAIEQMGRVRDVTLTVQLPVGLTPISVTYRRPDEAMPWLVVRTGPADADGPVLGGAQIVRPGTGESAVARDAFLLPLAWAVTGLLLAVGIIGLVTHVWSALRSPRCRASADLSPMERSLLALYVVAASGAALAANDHLFGRAIILSGGNDWLAYESFARDLLLHGPLLTEGRALGQGVPFYYQPLYIYWVALTHLVLGEGLFAPLFMNSVLGVAAGLGVFLLTRELFGRAAAFIALVLLEVCRLTVFSQTAGLLLSENVLLPIVPVLLLLLARLVRTGHLGTAAAAGFVLGLGGLARTTPLANVPPILLILAWVWGVTGKRWRTVGATFGLMMLVCTLTIGLATVRNYVVSGRAVPITSSAGANLWETHRPSAKVDLTRVDRDPLYDRLGLDRQSREVAEFVRQDPGGYVGTLVPMFLYAVGVVGAVDGRWDVQPLLFGVWVAYVLSAVLVRRARTPITWPLHAFVWTHLAQMTVFFSNQYGFRLILPMYVAMVPVVAVGMSVVTAPLGRLLVPVWSRARSNTAHASAGPASPAARVLVLLLALAAAGSGLGAAGWRGEQAAREAFYGLNGDAALAARQAGRPDLLHRADSTYFVGDDSRSTDVAYMPGLAFPMLRWFDGARGLVLPPPGEQALYVVPDRAAADVAKRCLGDGSSLGRERDPRTGDALDLYVASADSSACAAPREPINAPFAEGTEPSARLIGLDGPASVEPGRQLEVMISWDALGRPRNRARPFVRLLDSRGRRWGQAETTVYPSSSWRPGERAIGIARLDVDPTLPPGAYRLEGGFSAGTGTERVNADGDWGSTGLTGALGPTVRLVSRSAPLAPDGLPLDRRLDAALDGARLLGVDFDKDALRAGDRLRVGLFWQAAGAISGPREVSLVARTQGGQVIREWRGVPVDGTYPIASWKPGEIVRDTWDLVLPSTVPTGTVELAAALAGPGATPGQYVSLGTLSVQAADRDTSAPDMKARIGSQFVGGAQLVGLDTKTRRVRAGDQVDLNLVWQASAPITGDQLVTIGVLDESGRVLAQQESEPAGGKRPTSGWSADEYVEDGWKVRLPRDLPRGRIRLAVSLIDQVAGRRLPTDSGAVWVDLPIEVAAE